jgi:hypothetical protein
MTPTLTRPRLALVLFTLVTLALLLLTVGAPSQMS